MKKKPGLAVITGGTNGIGSAFAIELAARGFDLILTGRNKSLLQFLKQKIEKDYSVNVKGAVVELTNDKHVEGFMKLIEKEHVTLLINNAGFGLGKKFYKADIKKQVDMILVHDVATTKFCHAVIPGMIRARRGAIINVASMAAFFPSPNSAVYNASKAYLKIFSESLAIELKTHKIKVQALCPGFTETHFFNGKDSLVDPTEKKWYISWMTTNKVVQESLYALKKNKVVFVPGRANRCILKFSRLLPKRLLYHLMAKIGK